MTASEGAGNGAVELRARALLLDMDNTLVDSQAAVERIWGAWADAHGLEREVVLGVVHGRQGHESMAILLPERPVEENLADNAELQAAETASLDGIVPVPGAPELLASLRGLPHALVTSAGVELAAARMAAAGLPLPEVRVTAEGVTASKPHPEGFLKAAAELGIDPADCIVLEDSAAGIAAGRTAGMRVIGVGANAAAHDPTFTVPDLRALTVTPTADGLTLRVEL